MNDIEQAQRARADKTLLDGAHEARRIAEAYVGQLSPALQPLEVARESIALMIAVIAVCDAFGTTRAMAIEIFTDLATKLAYPAAVIE